MRGGGNQRGASGRFPRFYGEGGSWGKQGFPDGSEPQASDHDWYSTRVALHPLALAAVAAWCFVTALAGGLVGLVLGNIRLPALLLISSSPAAGAGANIGVSGIAAATAAVTQVRAGRIHWRVFWWMAPPSVVGAIIGGLVSGALPGRALLVLIGILLLAFGIDLLRPRGPIQRRDQLDIRAAVVSGAVIGFLGGVVGLILGSLRMPAAPIRRRAAGPGRRHESARRRLRGRRRRGRAYPGRNRLGRVRDWNSGFGSGRAAWRPPDRSPRRAPASARRRHRAPVRRDNHARASRRLARSCPSAWR